MHNTNYWLYHCTSLPHTSQRWTGLDWTVSVSYLDSLLSPCVSRPAVSVRHPASDSHHGSASPWPVHRHNCAGRIQLRNQMWRNQTGIEHWRETVNCGNRKCSWNGRWLIPSDVCAVMLPTSSGWNCDCVFMSSWWAEDWQCRWELYTSLQMNKLFLLDWSPSSYWLFWYLIYFAYSVSWQMLVDYECSQIWNE